MSDRDGRLCTPFDGLATRIRLADLRTVGFTSAAFGEGTSTLALGTSLSLASLGPAPVLLADANWLQPSLTSDAGLASSRGLADVLRRDVDLGEAVVPTGQPRLSFLAAGDTTRGRPPLEALPAVLDRALASFATILVDLPPALAGESMILPWAASLQQMFIVVRSGVTPLALARRAVKEVALERPQVVLNWMPAGSARGTPAWAGTP